MKARKNIQERVETNLIKAAPNSALVSQNNKLQNEITRLQQLLAQSNDNNSIDRQEIINQLRAELEKEQGEFLVDIRNMQPSDQCRQTITPKIISEKALSLQENHQRKSVILIPLEEPEKYEIEDGELTWRAAIQLVEQGHIQWQKIKAVISSNPNQDEDTHRRSLIHHLHSAGLNNLDRADALLRELKKEVPVSLSDQEIKLAGGLQDQALNYRFKQIICSLVNKLRRMPEFKKLYEELKLNPSAERITALAPLTYLNETDKKVLNFFYSWQVDNLETFYRSVLPSVFVNDYLKDAVRKKGLHCSLALILNKVQDQSEMQRLTRAALKNQWSKSELKQKIASLSPKAGNKPYQKRLTTCMKSLQKIEESDLQSYSPTEKQKLIDLLKAKLALLEV